MKFSDVTIKGNSPSLSRSNSPALSLSPLRSPVEDGSYGSYLEDQLFGDMTPNDKWKVAAARAPKIPWRSPETGAVPSPDQSIEPGRAQETAVAATPGEPTPSTSAIRERPATGESGAVLDALLNEFEPSSNIRGEERGWGETLSHKAVEELHQWLIQSQDHPAAPPPPHDRESRTRNLSNPCRGVETKQGSSHKGVPRQVREQRESEEKFKLLPIVAVIAAIN